MIVQVSPRGGCRVLETHPNYGPIHPPLSQKFISNKLFQIKFFF